MGLYKLPKLIGIDRKPSFGTRINWHHPLSQGLVGAWLFNEGGGGLAYDMIMSYNLSLSVGTATWGRNGIDCVGTGKGAVAITPTQLRLNPPLTLAFGILHSGSPDSQAILCGVNANDSNSSPWACFIVTGLDSTHYRFNFNDGVDYRYFDSDATTLLGYHNVVFRIENGNQTAFIDGNLQNNTASRAMTSIFYDTTTTMGVGNLTGVNRNGNAFIFYMYIWNRNLSNSEASILHANPYQMFWHPVYDFLLYPAAAPPAGLGKPLIDGCLVNEGVLTQGSIIRC